MESVTTQGVEVPAIGFGTARMDSEDAHRKLITAALDAGYRHFDTAQIYGSEGILGKTIEESDVDREDVFITTKLGGENREHDAVIETTMESLEKLRTDYVDLLMTHWPNSENNPPDEVTINAMNELYDDGYATHLGVSNHGVADLENAIDVSDAPIVSNQERYNILSRDRARGERDPHDRDLRKFCIEADVNLMAYSPLAVGDAAEDETVVEIAERHGKEPAQVALRWLIQQPMVSAIPHSSSPAHIRDNVDIFDFELSDDEMRELFAIDEELDDDFASLLGL